MYIYIYIYTYPYAHIRIYICMYIYIYIYIIIWHARNRHLANHRGFPVAFSSGISQHNFIVQWYCPKDCHLPSGFSLEFPDALSVASSNELWRLLFLACNLLPRAPRRAATGARGRGVWTAPGRRARPARGFEGRSAAIFRAKVLEFQIQGLIDW